MDGPARTEKTKRHVEIGNHHCYCHMFLGLNFCSVDDSLRRRCYVVSRRCRGLMLADSRHTCSLITSNTRRCGWQKSAKSSEWAESLRDDPELVLD